MSKKRICYITTIHNSLEWFVVDAAKHLHKNGYDISYLSDMEQSFIDNNDSYARCFPVIMERGVSAVSSIKAIYSIYKILRAEKFDVVQYATPNAAFYASIAAFLARQPIRLYAQWGLRYEGFKGLKRFIFWFVEFMTTRLSTDVREVSPMNMEIAIKAKLCSSKRIKVLGKGGTIGVNLDVYDLNKKAQYNSQIRTKYEIGDNDFVFGFIGRINADKGVNELIVAYKEFVEIYSGVTKLLLIGMEDLTNPIDADNMRWAKESESVILTGNVPVDMVSVHLSAIDLLLHPTYREGFGKILQEAMAMKVPLVTTNIPGPSEVIENGISGLLVEKCSSPDLLSKMIYLCENREVATSLANQGRIRVEQYFTQDKMVQNILNDMNELTSKNNNK